MKKYTSCYIYQNKSSPLQDFVKQARAPIEHLSNAYEWCNPEWCWSKSLDDQQEKMMNHVQQYHESNIPNCIPCTGAPCLNGDANNASTIISPVAGAASPKSNATTTIPSEQALHFLRATPIVLFLR